MLSKGFSACQDGRDVVAEVAGDLGLDVMEADEFAPCSENSLLLSLIWNNRRSRRGDMSKGPKNCIQKRKQSGSEENRKQWPNS